MLTPFGACMAIFFYGCVNWGKDFLNKTELESASQCDKKGTNGVRITLRGE